MLRNRPLKIGKIELIPKEKELKYYKDLLNYVSTLSGGKRLATSMEARYLIKEFHKLKIYNNIFEYSYVVVTEIEAVKDPFGTGEYSVGIIDDPYEVYNYLVGEPAIGLNDNGDEDEYHPKYTVRDDPSESIFFIVKDI
jgi:hypothetical protein